MNHKPILQCCAAVLLCLLLASLPVWAVCQKSQPGWIWNYEGELAGKHRIRMSLVFGERAIEGVYFYASQLKDIRLRGRMLDGTRVVLEEFGSEGAVTGRFEAEFPASASESKFGASPLACEVIRGTWRKSGSDAVLPVLLAMEGGTAGALSTRYAAMGVRDPETVHRKAQAFWRAVNNDERQTAAALIRYPIRINTTAGPKRYGAAAALLADYSLIFTPRFRQAIAQGLPRNMLVRSEGAMLGSGQVWFGADGRVIALNP